MYSKNLLILSLFFVPSFLNAQPDVLDRITVTTSKEEAISAAGSTTFIGSEELDEKISGVADIGRVLRDVPGVNVQDEDGYGLRPNIGFRGVPNERSARITLMEDGVLIAPAPYTAPSAYYFPPVGRMSGVEILKGVSQLKYGPYTTGGALNLLTTEIPETLSGSAETAFGTDNLKKLHLTGGGSSKHAGFLLETWQFETDGFKDIDNGRDASVDITDYQYKFRLNTDPDRDVYNELEYKGGFYDQVSNETYLGLTDGDFGLDSSRRYVGSQLDNIDADHYQHHLRHYSRVSKTLDITTTAYYNDTDRNWYKLEKAGGTSVSNILQSPEEFSEELGWLRGEDSSEGALTLRNNQRDYYSVGVQSAVNHRFDTGDIAHEVEVGIRYHEDEEDRLQSEDAYTVQNGSLVLFEEGAIGSQANRVGSAEAWAFYLQDEIVIGDLELLPVLRYETIDYLREDYGKSDPTRTGANLVRTESSYNALIPGFSVKYNISDQAAVFAGVHRGFSPPGAVSKPDTEEEDSINVETGFSYVDGATAVKTVLFVTEYDNLLGADTVSSGGEGTGELFNAGESSVFGVEFLAGTNLYEGAVTVPAQVTYTYTDSEFKNSFESDVFGDVNDGDAIPYISEHQATASVGAVFGPAKVVFEGQFAEGMPTSADGSTGDTDSFAIFDILTTVDVAENASVFLNVENLFDREYVAARRPAGARPGLPFTAVAGVKVRF